ncbi:uncharacterized protein LOC144907560 [Branchiostoma floridae x Branchiostoma belcheri]
MEGDSNNLFLNLGEIHEIVANTPLSRGLQTAYLVICLVIATGCNLLLIFLVWTKELLRKPRHYLRCNLALEDIIFTGCMIPSVIYFLFSDGVSARHVMCVESLVVPMSTVSMFGTYLLMAIELYHFICHPLHYGTNVTTKRVFIGIVSVRAFALFFGVGPTVIKRLQNSDDSLLCQLEPFNSTNPAAIFRNICGLSVVFAVLAILIIYYIVYKEARKQQERDEQRHLWLCQIKAFRKLAPHIVVLAVSVASYLFLVASGRAVLNGGEKVSTSRLITVVVANRIFLTVSSMVNPIIYSFRQPEFRRALRQLCGLSNHIALVPPPPPAHRRQDVAVINVPAYHGEETSPSQQENGQHGEQAPPPSPDEIQAVTEGQHAEYGEQAPPLISPDRTQTKTRGQQTEVHDERAPVSDHCEEEKTRPNRPAVLTVQAEVHLNPTPPPERSGLPKSAPPQQHDMEMDSNNFLLNVGEIHEIISNTPLSRGLQTAYLVICLVIATGCNLLLIFLVWKTELLRKPRHYLRCNLALEDIIFTGCMIPSAIYWLFSDYVSISRHLTCVEPLVVPMSTVSMFGTYLLMAIELYHFICHPLHYGSNVTTKRVFIGIVSVRAFALFFGVGPTVIKRLQNVDDNLLCQPEPFNSTSPAAIFRNICGLSVVFAVLAILIIYYIVYKEARKQQERDEQRHLWLCQIKAFRKLAPHIVVLAVSVASYLFLVASGRAVLNGGEKVSTSRLITVVVANRIFLTVSSMVNPIIYSFRQPEFRRALRQLCGLSNHIALVPPPPPAHRRQDVAVINVPAYHGEETSPSQQENGQHGEQAPPPSPDEIQAVTEGQHAEYGEQAPPLSPDRTQTKTRGQQTEVHDERAPLSDHCEEEKTRPNRPAVLTVQAEVHLNPTPPPERSGLPKSAPPQQHGRKTTVETFPPEPKSQKDENAVDVCGKKETVITRKRVRKMAWHESTV